MNNEMDDFSTPGRSNFFGYLDTPNNYIRPFKRPLSSISPVIVETPDGHVYFIVGAAGGSRIITATVQNVWHVLEKGLDARMSHHLLYVPQANSKRRGSVLPSSARPTLAEFNQLRSRLRFCCGDGHGAARTQRNIRSGATGTVLRAGCYAPRQWNIAGGWGAEAVGEWWASVDGLICLEGRVR